jgi:lathosterol oxidase
MDIVLNLCDDYIFDKFYSHYFPYPHTPSILEPFNSTYSHNSIHTSYPALHSTSTSSTTFPRDNLLRQAISLYSIALIGALILYYLFCSLSYFLFFDRRLEHHPRFLKNQIRMEIKSSMIAAPWIDLFTLPWFLAEVRGKSKLYEDVGEYGWTYLVGSVAAYLFFTDFSIYWIHRLEHHPRIYKYIHKPHHKWISEFKPLLFVLVLVLTVNQCLLPGQH